MRSEFLHPRVGDVLEFWSVTHPGLYVVTDIFVSRSQFQLETARLANLATGHTFDATLPLTLGDEAKGLAGWRSLT